MLDRIKEILITEADAIKAIPIGPSAENAARALAACTGKVFTTGVGKAGYVARKAASTFSTTGTPSSFIHPADASHGDVGAASKGDILLGFSNSGRTREVLETVHFCRKLGVETIITISCSEDTPLGQESDIAIALGPIKEACPFGLTPTCSTTAMVALADALALAAMELRGFERADFALRHHGGYLGKKSREEQ